MPNINDTYFDGQYKEIWREIIPPELTAKEVEFMLTHFKLEPGNRVLDLMCGYGRHAVSLARKGLQVDAVDNLVDYTNELASLADNDNLNINVINADVLQYKPEGFFDLVICMGNSLNFFNPEDTIHILSNISAKQEKGTQLLVNSWSLAEIVFKSFNTRSWSDVGEVKILSDSKLLFHPCRIESETTMLLPGGLMEKKLAVDYIYSINEMDVMFGAGGYRIAEIFSVPGKKKFAVGEPRAYIVAERI